VEGPAPVAEAMLPKLFASDTAKKQPSIVERARQVIMGNKPEGIAAALRGMAQRPDATPVLATIEVPTLVIVGQHDVIATVDEMRGIAEAIPDAGWVIVPDAGHMAPLENPTVFNQALTEYLTL
jgi:3-oxoadipate enol-lactonase